MAQPEAARPRGALSQIFRAPAKKMPGIRAQLSHSGSPFRSAKGARGTTLAAQHPLSAPAGQSFPLFEGAITRCGRCAVAVGALESAIGRNFELRSDDHTQREAAVDFTTMGTSLLTLLHIGAHLAIHASTPKGPTQLTELHISTHQTGANTLI